MDNEEYLRRVQGSMKQRIDDISRHLDGDVLSFRELYEHAQQLVWSGWQFNYWLMDPQEGWENW